MSKAKKIILTVTNDLNHDQRMIRICSSLSRAGYDVLLVGRRQRQSPKLKNRSYRQKRLQMFYSQGKAFYVEYQIRLFLFLLFQKADAVCSIDLDSILPGLWISKIKGWKRMYDAHELFCEMEEIIQRPKVYWFWKRIERHALPYFQHGYTVNESYQEEFRKMYGNHYRVVRNATLLDAENISDARARKYILYQGAVNEGRCFPALLQAMQHVDYPLLICGMGNYMEQVQDLIREYQLEEKVTLAGFVEPSELRKITQQATCGITLFQPTGQSNYLSLANRFFDYMHAEVAQLAVDLPEYARINGRYEIAYLIPPEDLDAERIAEALNTLISDTAYRQKLEQNAAQCKLIYNWQNEEKTLLKAWAELMQA